MSGAAKMRLTEITIKDGKKVNKFELTSDVARSLLELLRAMKASSIDTVHAEEAFPHLKDPQKRIGIIFRSIRTKNNLTQLEVANRLGIDQSDVSKIEKGKRSIGKALAKKIEEEFGIDYHRFL